MSDVTTIYRQSNHIAHITLNRPESDNIINEQLAQELEDICSEIHQDDNIYVVIVTGAGERAFCRGSELEQLLQAGHWDKTSLAKIMENQKYHVATAISRIDRPVIAAINGDTLGQGLELALSCDIRIASAQARFGFPQVTLGLIPMDGGTQRLPRLIGRSKTLELILTAVTISATEALEIGLVTKVIPQENLASEAETLAQTIASKAPLALRFVKEAINKGMDLTLEQGLRLEADLYFLLHTTVDRTEGIKAFLRKRHPQFKGQ